MSSRDYWAKTERKKGIALDGLEYLDEDTIKMLKETTTCRGCGRPLRKSMLGRYVGYCCKNCYNNKPPKYAYAEYVYETPIKELIISWLNDNNSIPKTAELIGVAKPSLYKYLKKHKINSVTIWKEGNNSGKTTC